MALEFVSKVLTVFKSDTSELEQGLRKLQGEEKKLAQGHLDAAKDRNKGYDDWVGKLANVNQALELGGKALSFAKDAFKAYSDDLRLRAAAGAVSLDKLKSASLGLRTEHDLLTFAAQTQNGAFKLNEQQMATAQKAMVALTRAGFDQEEVTKKVTEALVKANGGGLDDFGILVKSGSTDLEKFNNLMDALATKASGVDTGMRTSGESVKAAGVSIEESFDKIKKSIGELVASMAPLLSALASAVGIIADLAKGHAEVRNAGGLQGFLVQAEMKRQGKAMDANGQWVDAAQLRGGNAISGFTAAGDIGAARARATFGQFGASGDARAYGSKQSAQVYGGIEALQSMLGFSGDSWGPDVKAEAEAFLKKMRTDHEAKQKGKPRAGRFSDVATMGGMDTAGAPIGFGSTMYADALGAGMSGIDTSGIDTGALLGEKTKDLTDDWKKRLAEQQGKKSTFLESTFGKIEDFNAYATAFGMLTGGVTAAMDAWVTGSMSAGQAIKKFLADALKGLASQMAVEALKHGAYAIGSLAFGDLRGAGQHAAAAAAFGGGAAAAAIAAKELGGSASAAAKGGGAGASAGAGGGASSGGSSGGSGKGDSNSARPIQIFMGDYVGASERERRQKADEAIERALRERDA